jgi:murein DD-endopeptidase MepM/ murein hydrolase activator NlpD
MFITDPLVQTLQGAYSALVKDQYALYRARLEQAHLREANSRMTSELISLRTNNSRATRLEQQVSEKLSLLEQTIEQATKLGVFKGKQNSKQVVAKSSAEGATGPLAAILEAPELASKDAVKSSSSRVAGVGGSEAPCENDVCEFGAKREAMSLGSSPMGKAQEMPESYGVVPAGIEQRVDRAVTLMRVLPIGAPVNADISSGFGRRHSPFSRRISFHHGIDLSLDVGGKVMATGAGVVTRVAYNGTYGKLVDVEHMPGLITRYAHLSEARVRPGQLVRRGQVIALSGSTGRSSGPHLHYEIIHNGRTRNPLPFIELAQQLAPISPLVAPRALG